MKPHLPHGLCAAILAGAIASLSAAAQTLAPSQPLMHPPMQASRNADGSIKRGLRNVVHNGYWSGFAATAAALGWEVFV